MRCILVLAALLAAPAAVAAQTFTVTTTADCTGCGSLRDALTAAAGGGITDIDLTGLAGTITLGSPLPQIVNTVTITGPGSSLVVSGMVLDAAVPAALVDVFVADSLTKLGAGVLGWNASAEQFHTGATAIDAGVLFVEDFADFILSPMSAMNVAAGATLNLNHTAQQVASIQGAGTIALGDGTLFAGDGTDTAFSGNITGSDLSVFEKTGSGTLSLTGVSDTAGIVTVSEGTLSLDVLNAIPNVSFVDVLDDATLRLGANQTLIDFDVSDFGTVDVGSHTLTVNTSSFGSNVFGSMIGTGAIVVDGDTGVVFGGQSSFSGSLTFQGISESLMFADNAFVNASVTINDSAYLEIEGVQTFRALAGNGGELFLCFCVTLTVDQDVDTTFAGNINDDGGGAIIKTGTGRLRLAGINSYAGGTTVSGGILEGTTSSLQGNIVNDATVEFNQTAAGTFNGTLSGTGAVIKAGSGTVTFNTAHTYTGGTTINGGTLVAAAAGALGTGSLTLNGGTLGLAESHTATSLSGTGGTVDIALSKSLTVDQSSSTVFAGAIIGQGALAKTGAGTLTLTGANTYSGGTTVSAGTLAGTTSSLQGTIVNNAAVRFDQVANGTYAGAMSGSGSLVKSGNGTVTIAGAGTYTGGTTILGGVLQAGAHDAFGTGSVAVTAGTWDLAGFRATVSALTGSGSIVLGSGALSAGASDASSTFSGAISGAGSLTKIGQGVLTLLGANTYAGGTLVTAGTVEGNTTSLQGVIVNNAEVVFNQSADGAFAGSLTGAGRVVKTGAGVLTFDGVNSYAGGTAVDGGTLRVAGDFSLGAPGGAVTLAGGTLSIMSAFASSRPIGVNGAGTFDTGDHQAVLAGTLSGGAFTKIGSGTLVLAGSTSHTGGTNVLEGAIVGSVSSVRGAILNNALVVLDESSNAIFNGAISGTGAFAKTGAGALTVGGTQTYTGVTDIVAGAIELTGSLAGSVVVRQGARFGGSGSVAGDVFVEGTIGGGAQPLSAAATVSAAGAGAPGRAGTPGIGGDLTLAQSSVFETPIETGAQMAALTVDGRAIIDGATLRLTSIDGMAAAVRRQVSPVIAASEVIGGFGAVEGLGGQYEPFFIQSDGALNLLLIRENVDFSSFGRALTASGAGAALESRQSGAGGDLAFVLRELRALESDDELTNALARVSGATHASFASVSMMAAADAIDTLARRLGGRGGWWLEGLAANLDLEDALDPAASSADTHGVLAGYDRRWSRGLVGVAGGYGDTRVTAAGDLDRFDTRAYRGAVYGEYRAGRVFVDGAVSVARHRVRGSRDITFAARFDSAQGGGLLFGGVDRTAAFDYGATEYGALAEAGYVLTLARVTVRPAIGVQTTRISRDAFTETGADSLNLTSGGDRFASTMSRVRLSLERRVTLSSRTWLTPRVSIRAMRMMQERVSPFAASLAGAAFTGEAFDLPHPAFSGTAGIEAGFGRVSVSLDYRGTSGSGQRHHLISAGISF